MSIISSAILTAIATFVAMLLAHDAGRRLAIRRLAAGVDPTKTGAGAIEGAVLALLGLLIAFTFTGAASRFDRRRELILQETNAVGTAWMRLELVAKDERAAELRDAFRQYVDARIAVYTGPITEAAIALAQVEITRAQERLWTLAVHAVDRDARPQTATLLLPSLNEMFDVATARLVAGRTHVPKEIILLLCALAALAALVAGNAQGAMTARPWFHPVVFAGVTSLAIYATLDLEYPRLGLIRVDGNDKILYELRESMK